jgi:hypothetical protein
MPMNKMVNEYLSPDIWVCYIKVELGFAQTSNIEDPIIKPDQDW